MGKTINATETARSFSDIINSVKYKGESYTIVRGGKPAAVIVPVREAIHGRVLTELPTVIKNLPKLGKDINNFLKNVEAVCKS